jgi:hypothetical protein
MQREHLQQVKYSRAVLLQQYQVQYLQQYMPQALPGWWRLRESTTTAL